MKVGVFLGTQHPAGADIRREFENAARLLRHGCALGEMKIAMAKGQAVAEQAAGVKAYESGKLNKELTELHAKTHATIAKVTTDIENQFQFNTAIAATMELVNEMAAFTPDGDIGRQVFREAVEALVKLLEK